MRLKYPDVSLRSANSRQVGATRGRPGISLLHSKMSLRRAKNFFRHPRESGDLASASGRPGTLDPQVGGELESRQHCKIPACAGMTESGLGMMSGSPRMTAGSAVTSRFRAVGKFRRRFGFTLLEVMIALLVITLGMGAVIVTTGESAWKSSHLRESTIASWVAYNEIALYRAKRTWSEATSRSGEAEMANAQWKWEMKISGTDDPKLRRVDVEVFIKGETAVKSRVTGFIAQL
jgi:general secretion pathway protein I